MSIRLTENRLKQIIREELTRTLHETPGEKVSYKITVDRDPDDPDPVKERVNAQQLAMGRAIEDYGSRSDLDGESEIVAVTYRVNLELF